MSENIRGITFAEQAVTPADDAIVRKAILGDGILTGCAISYSGSTLTMAAGYIIACGRSFQITTAKNWAVVDATSGFARLLLTIDLTKTATETAFNQIDFSVEYASAENGFVDIIQDDINNAGTKYQIVIAVVSLGSGGITGIVSKLENAEGGGAGLNFAVKAYASEEALLAAAPAENTIGVITSTPITSYIFSAEEPSPAVAGQLWITVGTSSQVAFNALKKNAIQVYPTSAKQYIDGAWADVPCKSYQGGAWADWWNGELYDSGNIYEDVTGGWTSDETAQIPTITYNAATMEIKASVSGYNRKVRTGKKIDMGMWSSLVFDGTHTNAQTYNTMGLLDDNKAEVASVQLINGHELDISAFTGMYYVFFQVRDIAKPTVVSKLTLQ